MAKRESIIQAEILLAISAGFHWLGLRAWRQNAGTARSMDGSRTIKLAPKGASDIVGSFRGRMIAPEVKQPGKSLRREQSDFRREMIAAGALPFVWTSAEQAVEELIQAFDLEEHRAEIETRARKPLAARKKKGC
ncbi:MAG: hypothetical protein U1E34_10180 [Amaricoccus sp.]